MPVSCLCVGVGHPRVGGDVTCGFFVVSRAILAGWVRLGGGAVVPSTVPFMSVYHIFQTTTWTSAHNLHNLHRRKEGAWDGTALFCNVKRCITNKPRDPGHQNYLMMLVWTVQNTAE